MENAYQDGYNDGFRLKPANPCQFNKYLNQKYMQGYNKGKEDKQFCEDYSDEALGVEGYGP